jgi:hypothetical protein
MFAYTRGLATATKAKEVLPLKGIKVLDMTRVLAGVSSFSSFFLFHFLRSSLAFFLVSLLSLVVCDFVGNGVCNFGGWGSSGKTQGIWWEPVSKRWGGRIEAIDREGIKKRLSKGWKDRIGTIGGRKKRKSSELERKMTIPWKMNDEQRTSSMGILRWPKRNRAHPTVLERDEEEILTPETAQTPHETFHWQNDHSRTAHKSSAT